MKAPGRITSNLYVSYLSVPVSLPTEVTGSPVPLTLTDIILNGGIVCTQYSFYY